MYFLAASVVAIFVVLSGVLGLYKPPDNPFDISTDIFGPGTGGVVITGPQESATAQEFVQAVRDDDLFGVTVTDDEIRYETFAATATQVVTLAEGETLDSILSDANLSRSDLSFVTDLTTTPSSTSAQISSGSNDHYNRNVTIILGLISAALFAAAIFALTPAFNPLRSSLIAAGLIIFLVSMGFWSGSGEDWLGPMMSALNFIILAALMPFLEHGLPQEFHRRPPATPPPEALA
jgi:hypothetical protein